MASPVVIGLLAGGTLLSAYGNYQAGQSRGLELEADADAAERNAQVARQAGIYNAEKHAMESSNIISAIRPTYAASGISSESTTALEVIRASTINAEMDRQQILFSSEFEARGLEARAVSLRRAARNTRTGGRLGAFGALFGGLGSALR